MNWSRVGRKLLTYRKRILLRITIRHSIEHILWSHFLVVLLLWLLQAIAVHVWPSGDPIYTKSMRRPEHIRRRTIKLLLFIEPSILSGHGHRGLYLRCLKWIADCCWCWRIEWIRWIHCWLSIYILFFHLSQLFVQIFEGSISVHRWHRIDWRIRCECATRFQWVAGRTQWHRKTCVQNVIWLVFSQS